MVFRKLGRRMLERKVSPSKPRIAAARTFQIAQKNRV
jgi:hypothetical protein